MYTYRKLLTSITHRTHKKHCEEDTNKKAQIHKSAGNPKWHESGTVCMYLFKVCMFSQWQWLHMSP